MYRTVTFISAALGAAVSAVMLFDRLGSSPVVQPPQEPEKQTVTGGETNNGTSTPSQQPFEERTELERIMKVRVDEVLAANKCSGVRISDLIVEEKFTPADEGSKNFDSVYIAGEVAIAEGDLVERFSLVSTGNGPDAIIRAQRMAIEGFTKELAKSDFGARHCRKF